MLSRICTSRISTLALLFLLGVFPAAAQSIDVRFPTPVDSNEVLGAIPARDIGDARLTDHFYTFNGLPGDLLITIDSKNLNGDFDVFTAGELRPVLKVVVYADSSAAVTKNVYLRKAESLILRVEARTPNDDEGTYRIHFSGTFAPIERSLLGDARSPGVLDTTGSKTGDRKTTRVTSAGARIEEPVTEVAATPTPEPKPEPPVESTSTPTKVTTARGNYGEGNYTETASSAAPVRGTSTKPASGTAKTTAKNTEPKTPDTASTISPVEAGETKAAETTAPPKPPVKRTTTKTTKATPRVTKPPATAENGQLTIDISDGTRVQYAMSTVAKVTIENGEVVIVSNDGNEKRVPLATIRRMSIGP